MVDQVLLLLAETADDFLEAGAARNVVHVRGHRLQERRRVKRAVCQHKHDDALNVFEARSREGGFAEGSLGFSRLSPSIGRLRNERTLCT